ncbi:NmrA family NAD(P)-binding protein [Erythrobacter sp. NFXS35]|uniref:SDR family oxidoreductase n=1 Tax=Erythrobacter sp. NFXS35 TaxID=2818436 RepID=UPI0032DF76F8
MNPRRVLVIGGTGKIGSRLVAILRSRGAEAVPLARNPGPGGLAIDTTDTEALEAASRGFDAALLTTPLGPEEGAIGVAATAALRRAGVKRIVYIAVQNVEAMQAIPHFATKIPVKAAVLDGAGGTVLQPNFFFQNDLLALPAITQGGIYPMPIGHAGVWSIDAADIAEAAANALLDNAGMNEAVPLCGPEKLTGPDYAAHWAAALGREVIYPGDDVAPFLGAMQTAIPGLGEWEMRDFELMMQVTQDMGCPATDADHAATAAILGRSPRTHREFIADVLKENPA